MATSKIEWTESTWNPVTGCTKVSDGCKYCYAERMAKRLRLMGQPNYRNGFKLTLHEHMLNIPLHWKKRRNIFVNSMSDLFHEDIPLTFIQRIFQVMEKANWHQFQVLTKRSHRLVDLNKYLKWPSNLWMGVTVENEKNTYRIEHLKQTGAIIKFVSMEPLLGPTHLSNLDGVNWVILGGESGPGSRPLMPDWATDIRDLCLHNKVPFFFKQWGGTNKKKTGRMLQGQIWSQLPQLHS